MPLLVSGPLIRLFTSNLTLITACGSLIWVIYVDLTRRYVRAKTAIGAEVELGPRGLLVWSAIWYAALYVFLVFFTGALLRK